MSEVYESDAGGLQVLHAIATRPHAATAGEIANDLDADKRHIGNVLRRLYRTGYVTRQKREKPGFGANPYEYEVFEPEGDYNE